VTRIDIPDKPNDRRERLPRSMPEQATLHWRIYYRDGTMIDSRHSTWEAAPRTDLVAVVHAINEEAPSVELGTPYYWHHGDWIGRVQDVTLYLRQLGTVKFGRWASHRLFDAAWRRALTAINKKDATIDDASLQSGVVCCTQRVDNREVGVTWALYYDTGDLIDSSMCGWDQAPSDGILVATYGVVYTGIKLLVAMRRHTFYYWRGHELVNTDDLDALLLDVPQCKIGCPSFTGNSYRHQAEAIAAACRDQLEDLR